MSGLLNRLLGEKADELRKRMERSILVSKKLTEALEESNQLMEDLIESMDEWREILKEIKG